MEADRKAISVSGFIVRSLEPAKSKHQMSVREHSGVLSTPAHLHLLPKRPKISQLGEQGMSGIADRRPVLWRFRMLPQKLGTGTGTTGGRLPSPPRLLGPGPLGPLMTVEVEAAWEWRA